mgnify:CR=1 FL=1
MDEEDVYERMLKRLERIEAMLVDIEARMSVLEKALNISSDPLMRRALELARVEISLTYNLLNNLNIISKLPYDARDDISIAIMISLLSGPKNISQITEDVRKMRGKGSRRIVAEKLTVLENHGIVESYIKGPAKYYKLKIRPSKRRGENE